MQNTDRSDSAFMFISDMYRDVIPKTFTTNGFKNAVYLSDVLLVTDSLFLKNQLQDICQKNNLDAVIISSVTIFDVKAPPVSIRPTYTPFGGMAASGLGINFDFKDRSGLGLNIVMNLFDKNGKLLMTSAENTQTSTFLEDKGVNYKAQSVMRRAADEIIGKIKQRRY
ncbi:MAG TPA: hypothetical protein VEC36_04035 [Patescibacteria group bacterium]|nr:hypothetical protein [Patescibacteria group bacterium]